MGETTVALAQIKTMALNLMYICVHNICHALTLKKSSSFIQLCPDELVTITNFIKS